MSKLSTAKLKEMISGWLSKPEIRQELAHHTDGYGCRNEEELRKRIDDTAELFEFRKGCTPAELEEHIWKLWYDGMEDTRDLTPEMIEHYFGKDVVTIVKTLSKVPKEGYLERFESSVDWRPYVIKACDRLDNLRSLKGCAPDFVRKQCQETEEKYYSLFYRMIELTPIGYRARVDALFKELRIAKRDAERAVGS